MAKPDQYRVGVDPGGAHVGVALMAGRSLAAAAVVDRDGDLPGFIREVLEYLGSLWLVYGFDVLVIEDVVTPSPHVRLTNVRGLLDTAAVIGGVIAWAQRASIDFHLIEPSGYGSAPLASYPRELIGDRERQGTGRLRHARSAYDIANTRVF